MSCSSAPSSEPPAATSRAGPRAMVYSHARCEGVPQVQPAAPRPQARGQHDHPQGHQGHELCGQKAQAGRMIGLRRVAVAARGQVGQGPAVVVQQPQPMRRDQDQGHGQRQPRARPAQQAPLGADQQIARQAGQEHAGGIFGVHADGSPGAQPHPVAPAIALHGLVGMPGQRRPHRNLGAVVVEAEHRPGVEQHAVQQGGGQARALGAQQIARQAVHVKQGQQDGQLAEQERPEAAQRLERGIQQPGRQRRVLEVAIRGPRQCPRPRPAAGWWSAGRAAPSRPARRRPGQRPRAGRAMRARRQRSALACGNAPNQASARARRPTPSRISASPTVANDRRKVLRSGWAQ